MSQLLEEAGVQKELVRMARKQKFKRTLRSIGIIMLVILLISAAMYIIISKHIKAKNQALLNEKDAQIVALKDEIQKMIDEPTVANPLSPKIDLEVIKSEIDSIGELASVEYIFTDAAAYNDSKQLKKWKIPFTEKSFVIKWDGVIKAGIDLEQVSVAVDEDEKKITVSLPAATIISYEVNQDSVEIVDERNNILNQITVEDKVGFDKKTEKAMKERAIENGILEKAQANAEDILRRLLKSVAAIGDNYTIDFTVTV